MVLVGDAAPDLTAPLTSIDGDIESFTLSENLDDAPIVLAFFPAALTGTCTTETCTFRDQIVNFEGVGATVYGISIDTPSTLTEFAERNGLNFGLISDTNCELVDAYDVAMNFTDLGVNRAAKRAVFVVNGDGEATYTQVSDDPGAEPDYEAVEVAVGKLEAPSEAAQNRGTA